MKYTCDKLLRNSVHYMYVPVPALQLAHAVWMGRWNPRHDKDPSKKDEVAFKEFLISKYERKQWYRSPADIKREREKENNTPPATETKLLPPPSSKVHCTVLVYIYVKQKQSHTYIHTHNIIHIILCMYNMYGEI